jgi:hypothetical protein
VRAAKRIADLVRRCTAEFDAEWISRAQTLAGDLNQAANRFGVAGMGRSISLLHEYQRLYETALVDARALFVARVEMLLPMIETKPNKKSVTAITSECLKVLDRLADSFNAQLLKRAHDMGFASHAPSVDTAVASLRTTTATAVSNAIQRYATFHISPQPPWYQRPFGYVVLTITATIIATAIAAWLLSS